MYDPRSFGKPSTRSLDYSDGGHGTFLRLTPVPKQSAAAPTTQAAPVKTANDRHAARPNICTCSYCSKHLAGNAAEGNVSMKTLTNCACSPCSSPALGSSASEGNTSMASSVQGGFEMLPPAAKGDDQIAEDVVETVVEGKKDDADATV